MFMDWQNQHSKNGYTTKSNVHAQCNFHQNHNDIHHWDWKIYPKVHLETHETVNSQGNTEQKAQCWRYHNIWFQTILQSHMNKYSMVLAQKQIARTVEKSGWPKYESTHLHPPPLFLTKEPKSYNGEKTASSTNVAGKSRYLPAENWNWIHACHTVLVLTQRTLISDLKPCS
jgi:hypothetical protein